MATKQTIYGRLMSVLKGGTQIDNLTSNGLKQTRATRNVTTKDSADNQESQPTIKSRTVDFKAIASPNSTNNLSALQASFDNGTIELWKYGSRDSAGLAISGMPYWSASGFITALNVEASLDGNFDIDGTVELTGVVTFGND